MAISLFLAYFVDHFCYHSNSKSKIKPGYYILVILLINQSKEIGEKQFSVFGSRGGQMHVPLYWFVWPRLSWLLILEVPHLDPHFLLFYSFQIDWGDLGLNGDSGDVDLGGEIDFDISGITLESGGTTEGQVCTTHSLKLWKLVFCQNSLDKQCRPRSDCFKRSSLIRVFPVCYLTNKADPDQAAFSLFAIKNSSPDNQLFYEKRTGTVFENSEHWLYSIFNFTDLLSEPFLCWWIFPWILIQYGTVHYIFEGSQVGI